MDRLDLAFDVRASSRLACQAKVGTEDVEVWITEESLKAYMDENPDERKALEAQGKWPPAKFS
jgi:2Fe-2S ferredoxin